MRQTTHAHDARRRLLVWIGVLLLSPCLLGVAAAGDEVRPLPPPRVRELSPGRAPRGYAPPASTVPPARPATPLPGRKKVVGPGEGPVLPEAPPARPGQAPTPNPEDLVFKVDRQGGTLRPFPDGENQLVLVMVGNPSIRGFAHKREDGQEVDDLWIKANTVVVWIDLTKLGAFDVLSGLETGNGEPAKPPTGDALPQSEASVIQEAVLGLYAEGAVEMVYGSMAFRSERLYLEPPSNKALLIEPRFTGRLEQAGVTTDTSDEETAPDLPIHIRARQARLVAKGTAIFDEAEVSLSRADDRMALEVQRLVVREEQPKKKAAGPEGEFGEVPTLMGFRSISDQTYHAERMRLKGERLPLFYWGSADFSYPFSKNFPVRFRGFTFGNRSSTGRYLTVTLGGTATRNDEHLFDWDILLGGYLKRGPAGGGRIRWDKPRSEGKAFFWNIYEFGREQDASGFQAPHPWRWAAELESRSELTKKLQLDVEFNDFSDAGVNLEYFENDALTHKDRESYGRLRWSEDLAVGTLTAKWHQRSFVTETAELPQAALWSSAIPLLVPRKKGGLGIDLMTRSQAGYLQRQHGPLSSLEDYNAVRMGTRTTVNVGVDVGDVRLSAFAGADVTGYLDRFPNEPTLWRSALVTGARANLQVHKKWGVRGGLFQLDGLRHVIDLDVGFDGRTFDDTDPVEVPFFDVTDTVRDRSAGVFQVRNRLQTRGKKGDIRNVLDLDLIYRRFVDDRAPYLQTSPGTFEAYLRAQPRENVYVAGEGDWNFEHGDFDKAYFGAGSKFSDALVAVFGVRYVRGEAIAPVLDFAWRWSAKYGVRVRQLYNFERNENFARFVVGRYSPDHAFFVGVSQRADQVDFQFNFVTTVGSGGLEDDRTFNDEPRPQPFGVFPP